MTEDRPSDPVVMVTLPLRPHWPGLALLSACSSLISGNPTVSRLCPQSAGQQGSLPHGAAQRLSWLIRAKCLDWATPMRWRGGTVGMCTDVLEMSLARWAGAPAGWRQPGCCLGPGTGGPGWRAQAAVWLSGRRAQDAQSSQGMVVLVWALQSQFIISELKFATGNRALNRAVAVPSAVAGRLECHPPSCCCPHT